MHALQVMTYLAVLVFFVAVAVKTVKIARMPLHLRWDLYPIPHEKGKNAYGGSYFEEIDWWTKPKDFSVIGDIKAMAKEIILIQSVFHHNRRLWIFSFPFHFGMYCLIGFIVMLVIGAIFQLAGTAVTAKATGLPLVIHYLTLVLGTIGWILSIIGAVGLFFSRIFTSDLRKSSVLSDYSNLVILLAVFISSFIAFLTVDSSCAALRWFVQCMISFRPTGPLPEAVVVQLWLTVVLTLYFPFTHMTHFVGKYFTYHKIRWEDEPNIRGSKIEKAVTKALGYNLTWAAPHIKTGATWAEAATEETDSDAS